MAAVPEPTTPDPSGLGLPEALARAVKPPQQPRLVPERSSEPEPAPASQNSGQNGSGEAEEEPTPTPVPASAPTEGSSTPVSEELVVTESRSAADVARAISVLGVTYRPPDVWRERQPSLKEEWKFVMDGSHLPENDVWRALARGYAAPAMALIAALHLAIWILRSPARHATAWAVGLFVAITAALML
ncbi:hypothetical protein [Nocardiopsis alba]|uniref:hypothetical protein n=1 Tax=Nocardiopsis alba TaxID=53437 RepID=UPI0033BF5A5F